MRKWNFLYVPSGIANAAQHIALNIKLSEVISTVLISIFSLKKVNIQEALQNHTR
jgi:hypothetical protein